MQAAVDHDQLSWNAAKKMQQPFKVGVQHHSESSSILLCRAVGARSDIELNRIHVYQTSCLVRMLSPIRITHPLTRAN